MGQRGPKAMPVAVRIADGTYRKDQHGDVLTSSGTPDRPEWLRGRAAQEWDRVVMELDTLGILAQIDQSALALCCQAFGNYRDACDEILLTGLTFEANGMCRKHPMVGVRDDAAMRWLKLARELGLTPSARSGMHKAGLRPGKSGGTVERRKRG